MASRENHPSRGRDVCYSRVADFPRARSAFPRNCRVHRSAHRICHQLSLPLRKDGRDRADYCIAEKRDVFWFGKLAQLQSMRGAKASPHSEEELFVTPIFRKEIVAFVQPHTVNGQCGRDPLVDVLRQAFRRYRPTRQADNIIVEILMIQFLTNSANAPFDHVVSHGRSRVLSKCQTHTIVVAVQRSRDTEELCILLRAKVRRHGSPRR